MNYSHEKLNQSELLKGYSVDDIPGICMCMTILWIMRHRHFNGESPQKRIEWLSSKQAVGMAWAAQKKYVDEHQKFHISGDKKNIALATGVMAGMGGLKGSTNVVSKSVIPGSKQSALEASDFMKVRTSGNNAYYMIYCNHGKKGGNHVVCAYTGASGWISGADLTYFDSNMGEFGMKQASMDEWWNKIQAANKKVPIENGNNSRC